MSPSNYQQLTNAKNSLVTALATAALTPGPTYSLEGQTVDKMKYIADLQERIDKVNDMLTQEMPYELRSEFL